MKLAGSEKHGKVTVETTTWQSLVKMLEEKFNFMVIEAQGAEWEILMGMGGKLLKQCKRLPIECSATSACGNQKLQHDVEVKLQEFGFRNSGLA